MKCQVNPRYMEQLYSFYSPFYEYVFGKLLGPDGARLLNTCPGCLTSGSWRSAWVRLHPGFLPAAHQADGNRYFPSHDPAGSGKGRQYQQRLPVRLARHGRLPPGISRQSFDLVMAAYVITTVQDPHKVCREIHRVVKPGGKIIAVNHTRSQNGSLWGRVEDVMAPVFVRVGLYHRSGRHPGHERRGHCRAQDVPCNLLNTGRIIMGTKA